MTPKSRVERALELARIPNVRRRSEVTDEEHVEHALLCSNAVYRVVANVLLKLVALDEQAAAQPVDDDGMSCCGGNDETPKEHTQDCSCDCGHELADHGGHV